MEWPFLDAILRIAYTSVDVRNYEIPVIEYDAQGCVIANDRQPFNMINAHGRHFVEKRIEDITFTYHQKTYKQNSSGKYVLAPI